MSGSQPADRGHLATEAVNENAAQLESLSTGAALDLLRREDGAVLDALEAARDDLARIVDLAARALESGGRILYIGAGTSGRLGVLDASECPPTFGVPEDRVIGIIAGGREALHRGIEGAEDDAQEAERIIDAKHTCDRDIAIGIAAGGTTPFVHGALRRARDLGAKTAFIACVPRSEVPDDYDASARLIVGPEVLAGSSRMKAGTVTKLALNAISTLSMVKVGKTYRGHMVDVNALANVKLVDRGTRLIAKFGHVDRERAHALLHEASGHAKTAIVMARLGICANDARKKLAAADGHLARVIDDDPHTANAT